MSVGDLRDTRPSARHAFGTPQRAACVRGRAGQARGRVIRISANYEQMNALPPTLPRTAAPAPTRAALFPANQNREAKHDEPLPCSPQRRRSSASIGFYSRLFAAEPAPVKADYAKWMLDDPLRHLDDLVVPSASTTRAFRQKPRRSSARRVPGRGRRSVTPEPSAICCYAQSNKLWIEDPQGTRWETFHTFGEATSYYSKDTACGSGDVACGNTGTVMPNVETPGSTCCGSTSASCC